MSIFRELGVREGEDRINEEVVYAIARSYNFLEQAISGFLSRYDLTPAKFNILLMIKHKENNNKGIAQNEISKLLLVTTSNITRMVDKLEKDDYVRRLAKKNDRRVNLIKITEKGEALLDKIWPQYKQMIDKLVISRFSEQDKMEMVKLLSRFKIEKEDNES